jgi:hypothetical protein
MNYRKELRELWADRFMGPGILIISFVTLTVCRVAGHRGRIRRFSPAVGDNRLYCPFCTCIIEEEPPIETAP